MSMNVLSMSGTTACAVMYGHTVQNSIHAKYVSVIRLLTVMHIKFAISS
jgi:hypothetical protein